MHDSLVVDAGAVIAFVVDCARDLCAAGDCSSHDAALAACQERLIAVVPHAERVNVDPTAVVASLDDAVCAGRRPIDVADADDGRDSVDSCLGDERLLAAEVNSFDFDGEGAGGQLEYGADDRAGSGVDAVATAVPAHVSASGHGRGNSGGDSGSVTGLGLSVDDHGLVQTPALAPHRNIDTQLEWRPSSNTEPSPASVATPYRLYRHPYVQTALEPGYVHRSCLPLGARVS